MGELVLLVLLNLGRFFRRLPKDKEAPTQMTHMTLKLSKASMSKHVMLQLVALELHNDASEIYHYTPGSTNIAGWKMGAPD